MTITDFLAHARKLEAEAAHAREAMKRLPPKDPDDGDACPHRKCGQAIAAYEKLMRTSFPALLAVVEKAQEVLSERLHVTLHKGTDEELDGDIVSCPRLDTLADALSTLAASGKEGA